MARSPFIPSSYRETFTGKALLGVLQIHLGDLQVHGGLPGGLVLGVQEGDGFALVFCAETGLFAGRCFLAVENARSPEQDESLFHI